MTCHRRFTFELAGKYPVPFLDEAELQLQYACDNYYWYKDPDVYLSQTFLRFSFTVSARDQWWAHRRAMKAAEQVCWTLNLPVPVPTWVPLPPHMNRGRYRVPAGSSGMADPQ